MKKISPKTIKGVALALAQIALALSDGKIDEKEAGRLCKTIAALIPDIVKAAASRAKGASDAEQWCRKAQAASKKARERPFESSSRFKSKVFRP